MFLILSFSLLPFLLHIIIMASMVIRREKQRNRARLLASNYQDFMATYGTNGSNPTPQLFTVTRAEYNKAWSKFKRSWNDGILFNKGTQVSDSFAHDVFIRGIVRDCILIARGHENMAGSHLF